MNMFSVTGQVSDSSVIFFNKVPFIEIEYPVPHILKDYEKKNVRNTVNDVITVVNSMAQLYMTVIVQ